MGHVFILMDVLNVNYDQNDIQLNKWDAYSLIHQEIQSTYKGILSPYHFKCKYFEFDRKNDMASYLSPSYQAMECSSRIRRCYERWLCIPTLCCPFSKGEISYKKINE